MPLTTEQIRARDAYTVDSHRYQWKSALTNAQSTQHPTLKAFWLNVCATNRRAIAHYKGKA